VPKPLQQRTQNCILSKFSARPNNFV